MDSHELCYVQQSPDVGHPKQVRPSGHTVWRFLHSNLTGLFIFSTVLLLAMPAPAAGASIIIPFQLNEFSLINTDADGLWATPDSGLTLVLTGGNTGLGLPGTTDFWLIALAPVSFQFDYSYFSLDAPGFDRAGYFVGPAFVFLTDTAGQSGSATVSLNTGDPFGFRIETDDNTGEPGVFTVSTFTATATGSGAPEPGSFYLVFGTTFVGLGLARYQKRCRRQRKER